jgi:hypothetical protein
MREAIHHSPIRFISDIERRAQRKLERAAKRESKQANYHANGLNGPNAMARRAKQAENSPCASPFPRNARA